ncbi:MAG: potassium transporter [Desulfobacteraceae bacterium 4484_190.3]|nr:MAG: potassium transporter [Desulfobacteraceae bacterium 4484_190.3]
MAISIALIIVLGLCADYLFRRVKLPGLVGMLFVGILCGPYVLNLISPDMMKVSGDFRKIALIVILLRAGFELRRDTLNRIGRAAITMSCVPALFEIAGIILLAPKLLHISILEAAILGAILSAVSPAVVVPLMIDFIDRGRGARKGIPTLILAASSVDDVFVIVLFTIFMGMYGGGAVNLWAKLGEIPVSIGLGILMGLIPGYFLYWLFTRYDWHPPRRTLVVLGTAIILTWLEKILEPWVPVASLLGVMAIGFIILEKSEAIAHLVSQKLKKLWVFAELLLFVLVAAHDPCGTGLSECRNIYCPLRGFGAGLDWKEKLFCVVAYIPKATVQAAIGAVPLAAGVASGDVILAVAVLSILLTAPLGAIGIMIFGERILDHGERSAYRFKELRDRLNLPHVGERVRSKDFGTIWKIIEEKEIWIETIGEGGAPGENKDLRPAIHLRYWKENPGAGKGKGKTLVYRYSQQDPSFHDHWEVLYDW